MAFNEEMALNEMRESREMAPQQSIDRVSMPHARRRTFIPLATVLTLASVALVVPPARSQTMARSTTEAGMQPSICADSQSLVCDASGHRVEATATSSPAKATTIAILQPLTNAQMEQLSNILLGFLYFVLPVGFGLGLFLHDRYQAYRTATLEAQVKLLEKLWGQSPQA